MDAAVGRACAAVIHCPIIGIILIVVLLLTMLNPHVLYLGCPLGTGRRFMCGSRNVGPLWRALAPVG